MVARLVAVDGFVAALWLPEDRVEESVKAFLERRRAAHQLHELLHVVRHAPERRLGRALAVVVSAGGIGPRAVRLAREEVAAFRVPHVRPAVRAGAEERGAVRVARRLSENRGGRVVEREVLRARHALRRAVARHPAALHVRGEAAARLGRAPEEPAVLPAELVVRRLRHGGVLLHGLVGGLHVEAAKTLRPGLGEHHLRRRADHDARVGGVRPLREPAAFAVHLDQGLHHAVHALRRHEGKERMLGAVGVPERVAVVHAALVHAVVERAVVASVLVDLARIEERVVEARVEDRLHVLTRRLDREARELRGPRGARPRGDGVHSARALLGDLGAQVRARLLGADERHAHLYDELLAVRRERHPTAHAVRLRRALVRHLLHALIALRARHARVAAPRGERTRELHHEPAAEVRQRVGMVRVEAICVPPRNRTAVRADRDEAVRRRLVRGTSDVVARCVHDHVRIRGAFREADRVDGRAARARVVGDDAAGRDARAPRRHLFARVVEGRAARREVAVHRARARHERDLSPVAHPDRRLARADEAQQLRVNLVVAQRAYLREARHGHPLDRAERHARHRHHAAILRALALSANKGIDVVNRLLRRHQRAQNRQRTEKWCFHAA